VGAIYEAPAFYDYLSGMQNLRALTALSGWWQPREVDRVIGLVGLTKRVHHRVGTYSHGMRQRLALAQALLPMPKCLLLDEPTDGLDPEGIVEWRELLLRLRAEQGLSILLNSHLLSEVAQLGDRCVILRQGCKVYEGPASGRARQGEAPQYLLRSPDQGLCRQVCHQAAVTWQEDSGIVSLPEHLVGHELLRRLVEAGVRVEHWATHQPSLEELYLSLSKS
jgi:ABC-2 type transport system ATP-binding protein